MPKSSGATGPDRAARASKKISSTVRAGNPKTAVKPKPKATRPKVKASSRAPKAPTRRAKAPSRVDKRGTPKGKGTVKAKNGGRIGNPPFEPTHEQRIQVEAYVAAGAQQWLIAEYVGVSEDTLQRHFKVELDHGKQRVDAKVGCSIVQKALAGESEFIRFYAARRAGWNEKQRLEHSGPEGAPIKHEVSPDWDLSGLSRDELKKLKELSRKARPDAAPTS